VLAGRHRLFTARTDSRGVFTRRVRYVRGRTYRLRWAGRGGPATRVYRSP
jgi:hypothetical protein